MDFKYEALLEDKAVERRVGIYDELVEKGVNLTSMEMMLFMDRSFIWRYPVLNAGELYELCSMQSKYLAKKVWSPWTGDDVVSRETMDFLSLFFGQDVRFFYYTPHLKMEKEKKT